MIDLGFIATIFTWSHGVNTRRRRSARLDKGLCDGRWRREFPLAVVRHLSHSYADHCPLLVQLSVTRAEDGLSSHQIPCFMAASSRILQLDGKGVEMGGGPDEAMKECSLKLIGWNQHISRNIFKRKNRNLMRLEWVQRSLGRRATEPLLKFERKLKEERPIKLLQG